MFHPLPHRRVIMFSLFSLPPESQVGATVSRAIIHGAALVAPRHWRTGLSDPHNASTVHSLMFAFD